MDLLHQVKRSQQICLPRTGRPPSLVNARNGALRAQKDGTPCHAIQVGGMPDPNAGHCRDRYMMVTHATYLHSAPDNGQSHPSTSIAQLGERTRTAPGIGPLCPVIQATGDQRAGELFHRCTTRTATRARLPPATTSEKRQVLKDPQPGTTCRNTAPEDARQPDSIDIPQGPRQLPAHQVCRSA